MAYPSVGGLGLQGGAAAYWFDDNDVTTATTAIEHTGGGSTTYLTNDGAGAFSNEYNPNNKTRLWNAGTDKFDWNSLKDGDMIRFRVDIEVDTSAANQEIDLLMSLAEGTAGPYELAVAHLFYKTASTGNHIVVPFKIYMGDVNTRTGGARFKLESANDCDIKVNGWFYNITEVC